jgi:hypothetical protein
MRKIRLTERDLTRLVKKVIKEENESVSNENLPKCTKALFTSSCEDQGSVFNKDENVKGGSITFDISSQFAVVRCAGKKLCKVSM